MTPIFSNNITNLKSSVQDVTETFCYTKRIFKEKTPSQSDKMALTYSYLKKIKFAAKRPYMVKIRGILNARTMNILAQDQGQRCIKSKLYFFFT